MSEIQKRIQKALKLKWEKHDREQWIYGKLGRFNGTDFDFDVRGRNNFLYVVIRNAGGGQSVVPARNDASVPKTANLPVKIKLEYGVYVIGGVSGKPDEGTAPEGWIGTSVSDAIANATAKTTPVDADTMPISDSAASFILKKITWANIKAAIKTYYDSVATTLTNKTLDSTNISTLTAKNPPIDADSSVIVDSAASNVFKRVTFTNMKAFYKTYFDTLYQTLLSGLAAKNPPVDADSFVITDSAASDVGKRVTGTNVKAYLKTYFDTLYSTLLSAYAAKTTPVDADSFVITDSAASNATKRVTGTNLKVYLKTYFDGLYGLLAGANTWTQNNAFNSTQTTGSALSATRNQSTADAPVLDVKEDHASSAQPVARFTGDGTGAIIVGYDGATKVFELSDGGTLSVYTVIKALSASGISLQDDGGNTWMKFVDGGKSVGMGTTDIESVHSDYAAIQFGLTGLFLYGVNVTGYFHVDNAYYDGTWKRRTAAPATFYSQNAGEHAFLATPTGAINSSITWQDVCRIDVDGMRLRPGTANDFSKVGGVMFVDFTPTAVVGAGPDVIATYTIPGNTLAVNGQSIKWEASGVVNSSGELVTVSFEYGGTVILTIQASITQPWHAEGRIFRTGPTAQRSEAWAVYNSATSFVAASTPGETLSGTVVLRITGDSTADQNDDVICNTFFVEWSDNNT